MARLLPLLLFLVGCAAVPATVAVRPVGGLDPALQRALEAATTAAARDGVEITSTSGWRSRRHQERLFDAAVATYGSEAEAARWVARPGTSVHEAGGAADVGPRAGAEWLDVQGSVYGLCRIYANEAWHFELRQGAEREGCPTPYPDPNHDPRMR